MTLRTQRQVSSSRKPRSKRTLASPLSNVLVVVKRSAYEDILARHDTEILGLIESEHPSAVKIVPAHNEHTASVREILSKLEKHRIKHRAIEREDIAKALKADNYGLVLTLGGDGTVLDVSHHVSSIPILAVNSAPSFSHGHFCLADAKSLKSHMEEIAAGTRKPLKLLRLRLTLNGKRIAEPALNEVLLEDASATTRYTVHINGESETHLSDGIFFGTASGSTAWMNWYGCNVLPLEDRSIQFLVRGLMLEPNSTHQLMSGQLTKFDRIKVVSQMRDGKIDIDGRHIRYDFPRGSELIIKPAGNDLLLFAEPDANNAWAQAQAKRKAASCSPCASIA